MDKSSIDILMEENYYLKNNLRDQFAVAALTGMIAGRLRMGITMGEVASAAYEYADACLAERQRKDTR